MLLLQLKKVKYLDY